MASDELGAAPVRGHHLGTVELTEWCTLQVRVGAPIDMRGPGRAVRGRERCTQSQTSWFQALPNVFVSEITLPHLDSASILADVTRDNTPRP